ncbi:DUF3592 domain-containing protein [Streptomyces albireticuli]|uniref:DUF3592 domain-containing protein n=1 Tax=Streptomyces albireticuli TaxID=1940 RepID=A0A2A2CZ06_9ACTN|nr:DUF3592 domain-containing protein [Streptomyces albireticuli]MCD9145175.1 hypothetical protein [Streptomyces albireticuli]MCD9164650.1 hypothetical protein [Streptomyces albireticuli]MCD9194915.1 hypothetical protein [Streptomyces albireticuli]PAU45413.1 hypothetical protein CK936_29495 [Streptomyces albireticuli]
MLLVLGGVLFLASAPIAVITLVFGRQDRRLRKRGVTGEAVCLERIYRDSSTPVYVSCRFSPGGSREVEATVASPRPAPRVGDSFTVVFDPADPAVAQSEDGLRHPFASVVTACSTAVLVAGLLLGGAGALYEL